MPKTDSFEYSSAKSKNSPYEKISKEDFYRLNAQFCKWLLKEKSLYFDELSSEESRQYFKKFVKSWNNKKLRDSYYSSKKEEKSGSGPTEKFTRYSWKFKKNGSSVERKDSAIAYGEDGPYSGGVSSRNHDTLNTPSESGNKSTQEHKFTEKRIRQRQKEKLEDVLEEFAPKESGRLAMIAEKRAKNKTFHVDKDYDIDIPESELMGESSFHNALMEERARNRKRESRKPTKGSLDSDKFQEYMNKENSTIEMLRQLAQQNKR